MPYQTLETPSDPHWIDLQRSEDISFWMQAFGVTENALRGAVQCVGSVPEAVQRYLQVRTTPGQATSPIV